MIHLLKTHTLPRLCCLIICLLLVKSISGQSTFIKIDTTTYINVELLKSTDKNYSNYIRQQKAKGSVVSFTPAEVDAFGLKDGRVFYAFSLDSAGDNNRYFFERIFNGKYTLYFLNINGDQRGYYFKADEDSPLQAIPKEKEEYIAFFDSYLQDCAQSKKNIRFLKLSKARLIRFMRDYETCAEVHLPKVRVELKGGIRLIQYTSPSDDLLFANLDFPVNTNYFLGASIEYPLGMSNFSFIGEVNAAREVNSFTFIKNIDYDLSINAWRINVPLLFRYSFFSRKHFPFIELGPIYSNQFQAENFLIRYTGIGGNTDQVFIDYIDPPLFSHQFGAGLGAGMVFNYDSSISLLVQMGINKLFPITGETSSFGSQSITLGIGILF